MVCGGDFCFFFNSPRILPLKKKKRAKQNVSGILTHEPGVSGQPWLELGGHLTLELLAGLETGTHCSGG